MATVRSTWLESQDKDGRPVFAGFVAPVALDGQADAVVRGQVTQTVLVNVASLAAGYSASGTQTNASAQALVGVSSGRIVLDRASELVNVQAAITFGASINSDPDVLILVGFDDGAGGIVWDHTSAPFALFSVPRTASTTVTCTRQVVVSGVKALQVIVRNNDSVNALGAVVVRIREVA